MSSLTRRIQRRWLRNQEGYTPKPQPLVHLPDGGYKTLHPTKGWIKTSGKRVKMFSTTTGDHP